MWSCYVSEIIERSIQSRCILSMAAVDLGCGSVGSDLKTVEVKLKDAILA